MKPTNRFRPIDLTLASLFVAMTAIGANITTFAPFMTFGTIPITLQTFFAVMAGLVLGKRLGAFAMLVYMLVGLVGIPVFAGAMGGLGIIMKPTFGFILSFIPAAYVAGWIVENRKGFLPFILGAAVGTIINYVFGTTWMYFFTIFGADAGGFTYGMAWKVMLPFMPKDAILAIFAGIFATRLHSTFLSRSRYYNHTHTT
ncbi:biotin transporter BioY [Bacillus spongiae]|uniref:Biotin transporter n=1 Tax=Bacillus spongiae TaxID=2683610 RepID=A0ABU8HGI9_9BACI